MKTAFFGSPAIAAHLLELLLENKNLSIPLVITQPDKPVGKRLAITPTPVKKIGMEKKISVFDGNIRDKAILSALEAKLKAEHFELGILFAYGALIPEDLINLFPQGIWNVHPSLLPLYRGPAPTAYPLLLGDTITGVTIMKLVKKLDAGPIIAQEKITIDSLVTRNQLEEILTVKGSLLIGNAVEKLAKKVDLTTPEQDHAKSTYTRLLKKEDGYISSQLIRQALLGHTSEVTDKPDIIKEYMTKYDILKPFTACEIVTNMYRALTPWPGIWTTIQTAQGTKRLKLNNLSVIDNKLEITEVQLEGKNPVEFSTFNKAYNFV